MLDKIRGTIDTHLVNIEAYHSINSLAVQKVTVYGSRVFNHQAIKGSVKGYGKVKNVYSLVISKHKIKHFNATPLHLHSYGTRGYDEPDIQLPGVHYCFLELAKFLKIFAELQTDAEKLFYLVKKVDKMLLPLKEAIVYIENGGVMAEALDSMVNYELSQEYKDMIAYIECEKALRVSHLEKIAASAKHEGKMEGKLESRLEGRLEG